MAISDNTLASLRQLVQDDPALLSRLQQIDDSHAAAQVLAEAARLARLDITVDALREYLEESAQQAAAQTLNDVQLETVAGGLDKKAAYVAISIFSLGIGCAVVSGMTVSNGVPVKKGQHFMDIDYCPR
jgi:hypothetical protein